MKYRPGRHFHRRSNGWAFWFSLDLRNLTIPRASWYYEGAYPPEHAAHCELSLSVGDGNSDPVFSVAVAKDLSERQDNFLDWLLPDRRGDDFDKGWMEHRQPVKQAEAA